MVEYWLWFLVLSDLHLGCLFFSFSTNKKKFYPTFFLMSKSNQKNVVKIDIDNHHLGFPTNGIIIDYIIYINHHEYVVYQKNPCQGFRSSSSLVWFNHSLTLIVLPLGELLPKKKLFHSTHLKIPIHNNSVCWIRLINC